MTEHKVPETWKKKERKEQVKLPTTACYVRRALSQAGRAQPAYALPLYFDAGMSESRLRHDQAGCSLGAVCCNVSALACPAVPSELEVSIRSLVETSFQPDACTSGERHD